MAPLTWVEVAKVHGTMQGVGVRDGVATSLICNVGWGFYENKVEANRIQYILGSRAKKAYQALLEAKIRGTSLRVFTKRVRDVWDELGSYTVANIDDMPERPGYWCVTLLRCSGEGT